jgi:enediyne biosynthesis protein E4
LSWWRNDGCLDLFVTGQSNTMLRNNGDGSFTKVTEGAVVNDGGRSWGCAWADYNNDGYLDLVVVNNGYVDGSGGPMDPLFLYRNNGGPNHWLVLRLVGVVSNRSAIGGKAPKTRAAGPLIAARTSAPWMPSQSAAGSMPAI